MFPPSDDLASHAWTFSVMTFSKETIVRVDHNIKRTKPNQERKYENAAGF